VAIVNDEASGTVTLSYDNGSRLSVFGDFSRRTSAGIDRNRYLIIGTERATSVSEDGGRHIRTSYPVVLLYTRIIQGCLCMELFFQHQKVP